MSSVNNLQARNQYRCLKTETSEKTQEMSSVKQKQKIILSPHFPEWKYGEVDAVVASGLTHVLSAESLIWND